MFKKILFIASFLIGGFSYSQTINDVLSKYEEKNGGAEKFASVTTLQYSSLVKMNMMGNPFDLPVSTYIETGRLFRKEMAGMFGMKGSYTLITDTGGYTFSPSIPAFGEFQGMEGGVKKMDDETYKLNKSKMNAMEDFAALIDCKSKGFTPELLGTEKVEKSNCFKIKLTAKNGNSTLFYVDDNTYLIKLVEVAGEQIINYLGVGGGPMKDMMGGRIGNQKMKIFYTEYATVDGIPFPTKQKLQVGAVDIEIENSDIQMNATIDKKLYGITK